MEDFSKTSIDPKPRIDRPLLAYAFLAQATPKAGDLLSGLVPIFIPIAKRNMGKRFDAREFSTQVGEMYGIAISPWAVDDLSPRLEKAGLLFKEALTASTYEYFYADIPGDFNEVSENDIRDVVDHFIKFATPILEGNGLSVDNKTLERAFFDELTQIDFHTILLKPDRPEQASSTLALPKSADEQNSDKAISSKSRLDVLCAAFVIAMRQSDKPVFDLIVKIAAGALVVQVVLNMQDPGPTVSLSGLRVFLDAPILMSLLDLGEEKHHEYALQLSEQLTEHGAHLEVFRHSVDEIRDNLKASVSAAESGTGYGATVRRLRNSMYRNYVSSVRADLEGTIGRLGIRVVEPVSRVSVFQHFTQEDEEGVYNMLGHFYNPLAQERDAASIAAVMRMRQGKHARMGQFHLAICLFVTENPRVAECGSRFAVIRKLIRPNEVPPAVTDRYLAGMLWVLFGGKANELTEYRLLASCSAALEARNDVSLKVHQFLKKIDGAKAEHFRALMTTERSGQHLMQLTLGDSTLIRSTDDADRLLSRLDEEYRQQYKKESGEIIERVRTQADSEVKRALTLAEQSAEQARAAEAEAMLAHAAIEKERDEAKVAVKSVLDSTDKQLAERSAQVESIRVQLESERKRRLLEKVPIITQSMKIAHKKYRGARTEQAVLLFVCITAATAIGTNVFTDWKPWLGLVSALLVGCLTVLFSSVVLEPRFGRRAIRLRDESFDASAKELGFLADLNAYCIDWDNSTVALAQNAHVDSAQQYLA
jgi:hypothetical protein